ncbi:MAG: YitT family protein [Desulfobacterales bacterium]|nr:YitT family protein [Desulfobacterales bacterium]MDX2510937.1 YitT family protein [Desulfobacterales bacterium]
MDANGKNHTRKFDITVDIIKNLALISLGNTLIAMAVNGIVIPHQFLSGGVTGAALLLHYLFSFLPLAPLYLLLNIPLFAIGWVFVGRRFFIYSIIGMLILTGTLEWVHVSIPLEDKLLGAIFAGILTGIGGGLTLRSRGSAGGLDILSVILLKRFSIAIGKTILTINAVVLTVTTLLFSLETALYSFIYIYITARMMDLVITGLSKRKAVLIISDRWAKISEEILHRMNRGVTLLHGQGGYSGKAEKILYAIVSMRELHRIKRIAQNIDPGSFLVVQDTLEVMGQGIGNQPHW